MLCEKCKIREANIQYTEVVNGVRKEHNFCSHCAKEMDFGPYTAIFDGEFPLGKLLSGLLGEKGEDHEKEKLQKITCPSCHTSYQEFIKNSRFGCKECYSVFGPLIQDNLKQLQGNDCHTGKSPKHTAPFTIPAQPEDFSPDDALQEGAEDVLLKWDAKLKDALKKEEYEMAAICRDKIRDLKKGMGTSDEMV